MSVKHLLTVADTIGMSMNRTQTRNVILPIAAVMVFASAIFAIQPVEETIFRPASAVSAEQPAEAPATSVVVEPVIAATPTTAVTGPTVEVVTTIAPATTTTAPKPASAPQPTTTTAAPKAASNPPANTDGTLAEGHYTCNDPLACNGQVNPPANDNGTLRSGEYRDDGNWYRFADGSCMIIDAGMARSLGMDSSNIDPTCAPRTTSTDDDIVYHAS